MAKTVLEAAAEGHKLVEWFNGYSIFQDQNTYIHDVRFLDHIPNVYYFIAGGMTIRNARAMARSLDKTDPYGSTIERI